MKFLIINPELLAVYKQETTESEPTLTEEGSKIFKQLNTFQKRGYEIVFQGQMDLKNQKELLAQLQWAFEKLSLGTLRVTKLAYLNIKQSGLSVKNSKEEELLFAEASDNSLLRNNFSITANKENIVLDIENNNIENALEEGYQAYFITPSLSLLQALEAVAKSFKAAPASSKRDQDVEQPIGQPVPRHSTYSSSNLLSSIGLNGSRKKPDGKERELTGDSELDADKRDESSDHSEREEPRSYAPTCMKGSGCLVQ